MYVCPLERGYYVVYHRFVITFLFLCCRTYSNVPPYTPLVPVSPYSIRIVILVFWWEDNKLPKL